jgi:anti-sigma factor RsiW
VTHPYDDLPELVLGTLDGARRGTVLAHVAACGECRAEVESLARVTDALWLVVPEAEPPAGFEARAARLVPRRARAWPRRVLYAAAALLLVAAGFVAGRGSPTSREAGEMRDGARRVVGYAVVAGGDRPYVYVTVEGWGESGDYVVEVVDRDGAHTAVTPVHIAAGRGAAGGPLPVAFRDVRAVWVTDAAHREWCAYRV